MPVSQHMRISVGKGTLTQRGNYVAGGRQGAALGGDSGRRVPGSRRILKLHHFLQRFNHGYLFHQDSLHLMNNYIH